MLNESARIFSIIKQLVTLPTAKLQFSLNVVNPDDVKSTYNEFTKLHPKYKIIKNKSLGVALIELKNFHSKLEYIKSLKGNGDLNRLVKKAYSLGYIICQIDRNNYIDDIYEIHTSSEFRQGRPMSKAYTEKQTSYYNYPNYRYYGVLNNNGKLVAYANLGFYGNFAAFERLLGYRNNDGIMHMMLTEIISSLIDEGKVSYVMYDTFFGARPSFKAFKERFGFKPYRVNYSIE